MEEERTLPKAEEAKPEETEETVEPAEEAEETVESLKERLTKAEEERDNYKKGLLKAKEKPEKKLPVVKDDIDDKVKSVLYRENEKTALKAVIDPESEHYIPELVELDTWKAVMGYLPANLDKSSVGTIHKGLKAALAAYNSVEGKKEDIKEEGKEAKADLLKSSKSSGPASKGTKTPTLNIPKREKMTDWYPKQDV